MTPRVIAIGGSAGAIDVLRLILPVLPSGFEPSVMVTVHVPENRPSLLASIFADQCRLPVSEADDKQPLMRGTIVFAPPGYHLLVESNATLALANDEPVYWSRPSIDVMFHAVAEAFRASAVGVLLTGASHDGADGLARIKATGGKVIVQDPETCVADTMPRAGIAKAKPELVLSPHAIARYLSTLGTQSEQELA
ncbi:MAG: chemotaxis protein CheB [Clostridia bacterium]|nr:chemotaxis protein CheB [Deltaproteobacteria bacterium]